MDNQAESERELILWIRECSGNLLVVRGALVVTSVGQHANQSVHSADQIGCGSLEGVSFAVLVVGNVFVVPWRLEAVTLSLDIVSKESTLSEWVSTLIGRKSRVVRLQWSKHVKRRLKSCWVVLFKDSLGLSCN